MSFTNNVTTMNGGVGLALSTSGSTVDTFKGEPGNPSGGIPMDKVLGYGIQAVWTAANSPVGVLSLQVSMDNVNWTTLAGTNVSLTGSAGNTLWRDASPFYKYVRVAYTSTSGGTTDLVTCKMYKLTRTGL
jgi:hypothetical protein